MLNFSRARIRALHSAAVTPIPGLIMDKSSLPIQKGSTTDAVEHAEEDKQTANAEVSVSEKTSTVMRETDLTPNTYFNLDQEDLPQDFNLHGLLPIDVRELSQRFMRDQGSIDEFVAWCPLINMPVYTSKLVALLTGGPTPVVSDSMKVVRLYYVVMRWLLNADFTRSRLRVSLDWLCNQADSGKLERGDVALFVENAITRGDGNALALLDRFDQKQGKLNGADIEKIVNREGIVAVHCYEPSPWRKNMTFREEVNERHQEHMESLSVTLWENLSKYETTDYAGRLSELACMTPRFLNGYEISILRLLSEASMMEIIPKKYACRFLTPVPEALAGGLRLPPEETTETSLQADIRTEIEAITRVRCKGILCTELPEAGNSALRRDVPSPNELSVFMTFLAYEALSTKEYESVRQNVLKLLSENGIVDSEGNSGSAKE